jgi:hypothetical protein
MNVKISISRDSRNKNFEYTSYDQDKMLYGFNKHEASDIAVEVEAVVDSEGNVDAYVAKVLEDYSMDEDKSVLLFTKGEEIFLSPKELDEVEQEIADKVSDSKETEYMGAD